MFFGVTLERGGWVRFLVIFCVYRVEDSFVSKNVLVSGLFIILVFYVVLVYCIGFYSAFRCFRSFFSYFKVYV